MNRNPQTQISRPAQEREEFARLVLRYQMDLLRSARRLCHGNEDRAQDFVQEALLRAYRAFLNGQFEDQDNTRAWLLRIMLNLYVNDYRRRRRWEAETGLETSAVHNKMNEAALLMARQETPAAQLMSRTLDETVERALSTLSWNLRLYVMLVDMEGQDYVQAAQSLGVPVGTIRSRLSRARVLLRPLLWDYAQERRRVPF